MLVLVEEEGVALMVVGVALPEVVGLQHEFPCWVLVLLVLPPSDVMHWVVGQECWVVLAPSEVVLWV